MTTISFPAHPNEGVLRRCTICTKPLLANMLCDECDEDCRACANPVAGKPRPASLIVDEDPCCDACHERTDDTIPCPPPVEDERAHLDGALQVTDAMRTICAQAISQSGWLVIRDDRDGPATRDAARTLASQNVLHEQPQDRHRGHIHVYRVTERGWDTCLVVGGST